MTRLAARGVTLAYGDRVVVRDLDLDIPDSGLTVIIGPNGCGKSTLLRALAHTLATSKGRVDLDDSDIRTYRRKALARVLMMLPQSPVTPEAITVRELVGRGRYPHQTMFKQWSEDDEQAVSQAMAIAGITDLADRYASELSGGQRQRAWIALALAQQTDFMLLDEPTTFLDLAHQFEVLDVCAQLHRDGRTLVVVLHDLNQAARYATNLVVMHQGRIIDQGAPERVLTERLVREVFGLDCVVMPDPLTGTPMVVRRG